MKQRDKNLLIILAVVLVVFCAWFFGFQNLMKIDEKMTNEVYELNNKYENLKKLKAEIDTYDEDIKNYQKEMEEMYAGFDSGASQEYTIKFLEGIENSTSSWIKSATLTQPEQIYTFGNIISSNPTTPNVQVYSSDNIGYATKTTLNFDASYEDFKRVISEILDNPHKCTLESLSVSYDAVADKVSGSFVLTQFAIIGSDREFGKVYTDNPFFGTDNIFTSSTFKPEIQDEENGNDILADYDVYLSLQSYESDAPALKMGFKTDASKTITDEANEVKDVYLTITGTEGDYRISYKVGNVTYPVDNYTEGAEFVPGVKLSLLVNCSQRSSVNDVSGANFTVINESDMPLYIKVINDDEGDPRFKINDKQGDIIIYQN